MVSTNNQDNYTASGQIILGTQVGLVGDDFFRNIGSAKITSGCIPNIEYNLPDITYEQFSNSVFAIYNPYGYFGLLQLLSNGDYIWSNIDSETNTYYKRWNNTKWEDWTPPEPNCLHCEILELLTVKSAIQLFKESGHTALDGIGMIPILGEPFDGLNALWYLAEGDVPNASLSAISLLPIAGDAIGKSLKAAKKINGVIQRFELVDESVTTLKRIQTSVSQNGSGVARSVLEDNVWLFGRHLAELKTSPDLPQLQRIANQIADQNKMNAILNKYDSYSESYKIVFLADLADEAATLGQNIARLDVNALSAWEALRIAGRTGGTSPSTALTRNYEAIEALSKTMKHPEYGIDALAKIQGHAGASFAEVVNDLDATLTYSKTNNITLANFDGRIIHWENATSDQSKGLHGLTKAIKDPKYADEFKGKTLTFEDGVSNARPGDHNSRIDIATDEPYRMIEIKNYSGDTKISGDVIRSQFIERDLFNASSLDEIRWLQVGDSKTSKETIMNHIRSNKDALEALPFEKLESLLPGVRISSVDDFINEIEKVGIYDKMFK